MQWIITGAVTVILASAPAGAATVELHRFELPSGARVVLAHVPDAQKQTTFTMLPLTMANDDAHRAQWSHLLEHMLIRSTDPTGLAADGVQFNGETSHVCLRLETFSIGDRWKAALARHASWLSARTFDVQTLEREKANITGEERATASRGYTSKFALAAWRQIVCHGLEHAAVHGDVAAAKIEEVQDYAAARVALDDDVLLASIGPIPIEEVRAEIVMLLAEAGHAGAPEPAQVDAARIDFAKQHKGSWDLPTRHAMWFWPLPDRSPATLAAASRFGRALQAQLLGTINRSQGFVQQAIVYPIIDVDGQGVFLVDCCLHRDCTIEDAHKLAKLALQDFAEGQPSHALVAYMGSMLARELSTEVEFPAVRAQMPPERRDITEGAWLLAVLNHEYAWNAPAAEIAAALIDPNAAATKSLMDRIINQPGGSLVLEPRVVDGPQN